MLCSGLPNQAHSRCIDDDHAMDPVVVEYGTPPQARELERQVERQHCRRSLAVGSCQGEVVGDEEAALVLKDHVVTQMPALVAVEEGGHEANQPMADSSHTCQDVAVEKQLVVHLAVLEA